MGHVYQRRFRHALIIIKIRFTLCIKAITQETSLYKHVFIEYTICAGGETADIFTIGLLNCYCDGDKRYCLFCLVMLNLAIGLIK